MSESDTEVEHEESIVFETFDPATMDAESLLLLADRIREPFCWYVPGSETADILDLLRGRGRSIAIVVSIDEIVVGFLVYEHRTFGSVVVCYHVGVSILPKARDRRLYVELTRRSLADGGCDYLGARTANPRIYGTLRSFAAGGAIYPSIDGSAVPVELVSIARDLAHVPDDAFEPDTLAVRGVYGYVRDDRSFMTHRSVDVEEFFRRSLDRDDGFLVLVKLPPA